MFKGPDFVSRDVAYDRIYAVPKILELYDINLSGGNEAAFDRLTGLTGQPGQISLRLKSDPAKNKTIYVYGSGQVSLTPSSIPANSRIKDSRHVHFDLGWTIQNATTIKLNFVGVGQIETIDMADYFNLDKTEFDWQGTFSVGGVDQVFRIHSHSLNAFGTILSIHRDRNNNKNTEAVIISIIDNGIDKDIVYYLADVDDTINVEAFGGIAEIQ
ncbi:MAG: hypothetical protein Q8N58_02110 [bacterium]|nr:hypothetical protein [bacterium]